MTSVLANNSVADILKLSAFSQVFFLNSFCHIGGNYRVYCERKMKWITLIFVSLASVLLTFGVMASLLAPNHTGLSNAEIEEIWLVKNSIEVEPIPSPPKTSVTITCFVKGPLKPTNPLLADMQLSDRVAHSPVNIKTYLCQQNQQFCDSTGLPY